MKKTLAILLTLTLTVFCLLDPALAETSKQRSIILMTEYQQMGWGETFQFGAIDRDGTLWGYSSSTREDIPYQADALLAWAESDGRLEALGTVPRDALTEIISLVETVPAQEVVSHSGACDAGVHTSYAIRKDRDGQAEIIVLGMAGDDTYENTDPAAQSLYESLLTLFRNVTSFAGDAYIAPAGFQPVDMLTFCGYPDVDLSKCTLTAYENDCEAGPTETESDRTARDILSLHVIGKKNSLSVTGNTILYCFTQPDGTVVASFEFYKDLLVMPDGMYRVSK